MPLYEVIIDVCGLNSNTHCRTAKSMNMRSMATMVIIRLDGQCRDGSVKDSCSSGSLRHVEFLSFLNLYSLVVCYGQ